MNAREIAFDVLTRWKPRAAHASQLLDASSYYEKNRGFRARELAMELVHGVMHAYLRLFRLCSNRTSTAR